MPELKDIAADPAVLDELVLRDIHPDDGMARNFDHYFKCGREAAWRCATLLTLCGAKQPSSILDFACGHGRVARYFRAAFPEATLYVSDINKSGVEFCVSSFDAIEAPTSQTFSDIVLEQPVSLIWSGSLFTHLDEDRAAELLDFFHNALAPGGLAVFTSHGNRTASFYHEGKWPYVLNDEQMKSLTEAFERKEYGFVAQTKNGKYGISITPLQWFQDYTYRNKGFRIVGLVDAGWDNHQDVIALLRTD